MSEDANNEDTEPRNSDAQTVAERCTTPIFPITAANNANAAFKTPVSEVDPDMKKLFENSTPPKIRLERCIKLAKHYGIEWGKCTEHGKRVLSFLFDRRVHKALEEEMKENKIEAVKQNLVHAMNAESDVGKRVSVILYERGQTFFENVPNRVHTYDNFLSSHPHWNGEATDTCLNLLAEPFNLEVFQQAQLSGNCYLHGAVSTQQYLYRWHGFGEANHLIDIPRYMRHSFNEQDICKHLFSGKGGRSENILKTLAGQFVNSSIVLTRQAQATQDYLAKNLLQHVQRFGPQLFANVVLSNGFDDNKTHSYQGGGCTFPVRPLDPSKDERLRHSLVLLGLQKVDTNWIFLFQNWHEDNQFFEADYDWVIECEGIFFSLLCQKGDWVPPTIDKPYTTLDDMASFAESSPAVDKGGSGDATESFTYTSGNEQHK